MSDNDRTPEDLPTDPEDKPLSIAEEIAAEVDDDDLEVRERYDLLKQTDTKIAELQKLSMAELIELARSEKIDGIPGEKNHDLIFKILKERVKLNGLMFGEGTLEILP
ncbi:MAG: Rho termination factor N-terminal domain-containing protein, partial [Pirellulales bacterium]|nr:Rho termination factor N-terminal domain-containing protein [Pirellulales bacterium]